MWITVSERDRAAARETIGAVSEIAKAIAKARQEGREEMREIAASQVPTTWLDNILSGPRAVEGCPSEGAPYLQRVLARVSRRIRALPTDGEGE